MTASFRIPTARAVLAIALANAAAVPALAQPAPPPAPVDAPLPNGNGCSPMMALWQSAEARYSALGRADLDAFNVVQNEIDRAAHFCEAGQDVEARQIMDASKRPPPDLAVGVSPAASP